MIIGGQDQILKQHNCFQMSWQKPLQPLEIGAYESIFIDKDGYVTEGSSSNIWILNN